jgi:3-dehydroquinate synthase
MGVFLPNNSFTTIQSARGSYNVFLGDCCEHLSAAAATQNTVVLIDENVARLHAHRLNPVLKNVPTLAISATEENKTWSGVEKVVRFFLANGCNRNTRALVIGGGIIQDISAFACHTFFRGIEWEFYPTTVLAMADSCIGAKSGLNFENTKNLVGVFENPQKIVIDTAFATTLAEGDLASGLGEILKLALIAGPHSLNLFTTHFSENPAKANLEPLIRDALTTKKGFIEKDEFDHGVRRMLNYGHTFGHALESVTGYAIPHGTAVVVGMDIINFISVAYGKMSSSVFQQLHSIICSRFSFSTHITPAQIDAIANAASKDKKRTSAGIHLAILHEPGLWAVEPFALDEKLVLTVKSYFTSEHSLVSIQK